MSHRDNVRIGLVGAGYIGSYLCQEIVSHPEWGLEMAFVAETGPAAAGVRQDLLVASVEAGLERAPALVVEAAHASVTVKHGASILQVADYMPLSLTALADATLEEELMQAARGAGTCLYVPHGAAVGVDSLSECRDLWEQVTVTMRKNPRNLDFAAAGGIKAEDITTETLLYDGPTRAACRLYPRNVNSHAAIALAGIGFDRTRSVLIGDPKLDVSIIEVTASGAGVALRIERSNPLKGVSGVLTLRSVLGCVQRAKAHGLHMQVF